RRLDVRKQPRELRLRVEPQQRAPRHAVRRRVQPAEQVVRQQFSERHGRAPGGSLLMTNANRSRARSTAVAASPADGTGTALGYRNCVAYGNSVSAVLIRDAKVPSTAVH